MKLATILEDKVHLPTNYRGPDGKELELFVLHNNIRIKINELNPNKLKISYKN